MNARTSNLSLICFSCFPVLIVLCDVILTKAEREKA